jgi:hypothetical protein
VASASWLASSKTLGRVWVSVRERVVIGRRDVLYPSIRMERYSAASVLSSRRAR